MKILPVSILLTFIGSASSATSQTKALDMKSFKESADNCEFFSGEWDSNLAKARQLETERQADKYCTETKKKKQELSVKYRNDTELLNELANYDFD